MPRSIAYTGNMPRLPPNGGRTQTNALGGGTCFPFINLFKTHTGWRYTTLPTDTTLPPMPILELDSNGYPRYFPTGVNGVQAYYFHPPSYADEGDYVIKWDGIGTLSLGGGVTAAASELRNISGFTSATDAGGRFLFVRNGESIVSVGIEDTGTGPDEGDHVRNIRICPVADEELLDAGQVLSTKFKSDMLHAKPGAVRMLGWIGDAGNGTNVCNVGLWEHNKPSTYSTWCGDEYRADAYIGMAECSGNNFELTVPDFVLTDKMIVHLVFKGRSRNDIHQGADPSESVWTANISAGSPGTIDWEDHDLEPNNIVWLQVMNPDNPRGASSGPLPSPLQEGLPVYVKDVLNSGQFTVSAEPGGAALNISESETNFNVVSPWALVINGGDPVPIVETFRFVPDQAFIGYSRMSNYDDADNIKKLAGMVATLAYDETTNYWDRVGGTQEGYSMGIQAGVPPSIILDACKELGCQPHIVMPYHPMEVAGDPHAVTDYVTGWAELIKARQDSDMPWVRGLFEPPNETWNTVIAFRQTYYAQIVAWVRYGYYGVQYPNHAYGGWASKMFEAIFDVYAGDTSKFDTVFAYQTIGFANSNYNPTGLDVRTESQLYVSTFGGEPASDWTTAGCIAQYYTPSDYYKKAYYDAGWGAYVINRGNAAAQAVIVDDWCSSALMSESADEFNVQLNLQTFNNAKEYFVSKGWPRMVGYEGGWSPDYTNAEPIVFILDASKAASCVLECWPNIQSFGTFIEGGLGSVKVGMVLTPQVAGMTQLNIASETGPCAFPASGTTITATKSDGTALDFAVDDAISFYGIPPVYAILPPELDPAKAYYVKTKVGNDFTIAATKGGAAITMTSPASTQYPVTAKRGWAVTAVDAVANTITLDCNSSGFSDVDFNDGGNGYDGACTAQLASVRALLNTIAYDAKQSPVVAQARTESYENWYGLTDDAIEALFFSDFLYYGLLNAWTIKDPDPWVPNTPAWEAIHDRNSNEA